MGGRIAFDATMKQANITVESILKYTDETEFARIQMDLLFPILKLNVLTTPKYSYSSMWKCKIKSTTFSFDKTIDKLTKFEELFWRKLTVMLVSVEIFGRSPCLQCHFICSNFLEMHHTIGKLYLTLTGIPGSLTMTKVLDTLQKKLKVVS